MQARPHEAIEERLVFYWAKTYASQLGSGDPHTHLKPVIGIYFLAFIRFPTSRAHSSFHINEDHEGFPLTDALVLHFLELPKYAALEKGDRLPERADGEPTDELVYWCKLAEDRVLWEWAYHQDIDGAERRGREQGLRDAVRTACELLGVELTDDRNAKLQGGSLEDLESLLSALKRDREWPQ